MAYFEVENFKKSFGKTEVLKGISFSLEKGEVLSVIGSSGGGKTTLLRCVNLLHNPDIGSMKINDQTIFDAEKNKYTEKDIRNIRLHFGLVFQQFNLFPQYNVLENVMLAPKLLKIDTIDSIKDKAIQLIDKVGLSASIDKYPHQLSGGQQQRVAIARALALDPDILCFDEPTSALDPELTGEVLKVIKSLRDTGRTMIIVTHEMNFAKTVSDKVMFISDGLIEEFGTPYEVFDNPKSEKTKQFFKNSLEQIG